VDQTLKFGSKTLLEMESILNLGPPQAKRKLIKELVEPRSNEGKQLI
jgi:hypothetical protein